MKLLAQVDISDPNINPAARFTNFGDLITLFIPLATLGAALIFGVMLMYGAFTILTAGGNPDGIKKAQKIFTFATIGLIIVLLAYLITQIINKIAGVTVP